MTRHTQGHRWKWMSSAAAILGLIIALAGTTKAVTTAGAAHLGRAIAPDYAAIDTYVETQMRDTHIPGVALAIVHGDQIVHAKGFGISDPSGRPITPQTPVMLASLAKPMTGLAIMQLVEAGKVELDAPVQRYLPWFRVADEAASGQITVRHLLYHTSGLPESAGSQYAMSGDERPDALEQQVRELRDLKLVSPVGAAYHYSNPNYRVLGLVIQQVSGQSYEQYMQEHVFAPLDMHRTFTSAEAAQPHGLATGYRFIFGRPVPYQESFDRAGTPSGGIVGSAEDVAHFLIANLNDGRYCAAPCKDGGAQVVSAQGIAEMQRPVTRLANEMEAWDWGVTSIGGVQVLTKGGDLASYKTNMLLIPDGKWGMVLLVNANDRFATLLGDLRVAGMIIGLTNLLLGQQPPNLAGSGPLIFRSIVLLVAIVQVAGLVWSVAIFRRWRLQPEPRPQGRWARIWRLYIPLTLNLAWGAVLLAGVPKVMGYPLSFLLYVTPELGYVLVASGLLAVACGVFGIALAYVTRDATGAPPSPRGPQKARAA